MTLQIIGRITEQGGLELDLPKLRPGPARVTIELEAEQELTPQEINRLLRIEPLTGAEIIAAGLTGGWEDQNISEGQTWVAEQRRRRAESRRW